MFSISSTVPTTRISPWLGIACGDSADSVQRVECTDAKVKWRIEGTIKNVSQRQFHDGQSDVCARYPKRTAAFQQTGWDGSERIGYVLCLRKTQPLPTKKP
jgi:hypothetical protein